MTPTMVVRINIFVSSPHDLANERDVVGRVVERLNRSPRMRDEYSLLVLRYEDEVPPEVGDKAQFVVDNYMKVEQSHVLICMFWTRMGTPFTAGDRPFKSGTHYEFITGYEHRRQHGNPNILLYRKTKTNPGTDPEQEEKVVA